jgi:regulatory protein YycI of two-component signal transduction system YycFG
MDWNKAKSILIIAFVVIDIFLLVNVMASKKENNNLPFSEAISSQLEAKNINIDADINLNQQILPILEVEFNLYDSKSIQIENFLGENFTEATPETIFLNDQGATLEIVQGKKLVVTYREADEANRTSKERFLTEVETFCKNHKINLENYSADNVNEASGGVSIIYRELYEGITLENSYYYFSGDATGIFKVEHQDVKSIKTIRGEVSMSRGDEALLRLLQYPEIFNDTIIKMETCYYIDEAGLDWEKVVSDNMDPTWKVTFRSGIIKYLVESE